MWELCYSQGLNTRKSFERTIGVINYMSINHLILLNCLTRVIIYEGGDDWVWLLGHAVKLVNFPDQVTCSLVFFPGLEGNVTNSGDLPTESSLIFLLLFIYLATPCSTWNFPIQGSNPCPLRVKAQSLNHWIIRKSHPFGFKNDIFIVLPMSEILKQSVLLSWVKSCF